MVMEKHKRWYDNDPTVSLMVSMLEKVDDKVQLDCARLIIKKANKNIPKLKEYTQSINSLLQQNYLFYKEGFMDYWLD